MNVPDVDAPTMSGVSQTTLPNGGTGAPTDGSTNLEMTPFPLGRAGADQEKAIRVDDEVAEDFIEELAAADLKSVRDEATTEDSPKQFGPFLFLMVCVTAVTGFLMGYDLCIVAVVLAPIRDHFGVCSNGATEDTLGGDTPCLMNELFVAILAPGAMVSSLIGGWAADRFGRRAILITSDVFFAVAATVLSVSQTYYGMLIGRCFLGVGIGMGFVVFPTYMAEVSPAEIRGALVTCQEVAQCIGCLVAYGIAYLVSPVEHWRILLFCAGIPAILQLIGTLILPESPRWLVAKREIRAAIVALERIAGVRPACGAKPVGDEEYGVRYNAVERCLMSSPSQRSESNISRLSRVRATRVVLEEADESGRRLADLDEDDLDLEIRSVAHTIASREASRASQDFEGGTLLMSNSSFEPMAPARPSKYRQPPLKQLLDLMEEEELRQEMKMKRRREAHQRDKEEFEAAMGEGRVSAWRKFWFKLGQKLSFERSSLYQKLRANISPLCIAIGCAASQNFTGANTILYYSVDLLRMGGVCDPVFAGVMIGVVKLLGVLLMICYVEKIGRRIPLMIGSIGTLTCHIALATIFKVHEFPQCPAISADTPSSLLPKSGPSIAVTVLLWGLMFSWNVSWAGLMFVVASEVLPSNLRGIGMGLTIAAFWVLAFVFQLGFRLMVSLITATGTFSLLSGTTLLVILFVYFSVPELTGKTLEQIQRD